MERKREKSRSSQRTNAKPATLELSPNRVFVLHLDVRARPPSRVAGRIEHITSGRIAHVRSLRELLDFLAEVLRNQARGGRQTADATLLLENCHGDDATSARGSLDRAVAGTPAPPIHRRGNGGEKS